MANAIVGTGFQQSPAVLMYRLVNPNTGTYVLQADISAIAYEVRDENRTPSTKISSGTLTVANVIYNSLQTSQDWTVDSTGYNFRWMIPGSAFPDVTMYGILLQFTPASGESWRLTAYHSVLKSEYGT